MNTSNLSQVLFVAAVLALAGRGAADTSLRGPVLGYVLDSRTQVIRPINGIPGAALLGSPLPLPFPVLRSAFSSAADFGLVVSGAEGQGLYLLRNPEAAQPGLTTIPGAMTRPDRIVLNLGNTATALYSAEPRQLQVVRGLPNNPVAGPLLDLSSMAGGVTALVVDRDAVNVLVAISDADRGALYRIAVPDSGDPTELRQVEPRFLSYFTAPSAITLLNQDRDAAIADARDNQIFLIRDFAGSPAVTSLVGERDGITNPVALEASADGRRLFVVNGPSQSLAVVDVETQAVEVKTGLDAAPTRLERLQGRSTFLLNEVGSEPLLLLDNTGAWGVYFVPAGRDTNP